ncbi:WxL domain-containing protein [Levilactobacillus fujinensis]|uniref:WxL domain-containing protein n=1 Tax=Levilactobacillus fujinensis TaxID=2486024 RepID=A0ABW1TJW4_9LACO|nr:WxL domain-containing protein [Levilactobacillus fujinensis]
MKCKRLLVALVSAFAILGLGQPLIGHADAAADADLASAKASMPQGLPIEQYFNVPSFNNATMTNSADVTPLNSNNTQAVQLTNDVGQLGTIWAKKDDFYFDLNQKQKASMWMYFGNGAVGKMGDGMAFVIQNQGANATSVDKDGNPRGQETMGVWGFPDDVSNYYPTLVGAQAIQKSWALEFDTFPNTSSSVTVDQAKAATSFDLGTGNQNTSGNDAVITGKQHIAAAYPAATGQGATYYRKLTKYDSVTYFTKMNHNGPIANSGSWLTNGAWHHLTVQYTPPTTSGGKGDVVYTINDKDPNTGEATTSDVQQSNHYELDPTTVDDGTGHAYWGFTGSTGAYAENNLVVFEQIPGLVDADASTSIHNQADNSAVTNGQIIMGGSRLRLDYNLTYNSGRSEWQPKAKISMPSGFVPKSGVVTYANGTTQTIDLASAQSAQELNFALSEALDNKNKTADITIYGRQDNPTSSTATISGTTSKFVGTYGVATADMVPYTVYKATTQFRIGWLAGESYDSIMTEPNQDVTVKGQFKLSGSPITSGGFTLQGSLNGLPIDDMTIDPSSVSGNTTSGYTGTFSYTVPAAKLQHGKNELLLHLLSYDGYTTDDLISDITVSGPLAFGNVDDNVSYTADLTGSHMLVPRDGPWQINVDDQRGTGSSWQLTAQMSAPLQASNLPATTMNLVYKSSADATPVVLGSSTEVVAKRTTTSDDDSFNATSQWSDDSGLLLDVSSGAVAGTYTGTIQWGLENAPG